MERRVADLRRRPRPQQRLSSGRRRGVDDFFFSACVYSSDQNVWSTPIIISVPRSHGDRRRLSRGPKALIGNNALYSKFYRRPWIVEYDACVQTETIIHQHATMQESAHRLCCDHSGGWWTWIRGRWWYYTPTSIPIRGQGMHVHGLNKDCLNSIRCPLLSDAINPSRAGVAAAANAFSLIIPLMAVTSVLALSPTPHSSLQVR
jgi:hypothetical protein